MKVIKPDTKFSLDDLEYELGMINLPTVFVAGSIENGKASEWQNKFVDNFKDLNVVFYNPRRDDWHPEWSQTPNHPDLIRQINWELMHLEKSDYIVVYFDPETTSPVTLLEVGIHIHSPKLFVCCPDGYYRKTNVKVSCDFYGVPFYDTLDELTEHMKVIIKEQLQNEE